MALGNTPCGNHGLDTAVVVVLSFGIKLDMLMEFEHLQFDGKVLHNLLLQIPPFPQCLKEDTNAYKQIFSKMYF